MGHIQKRKDGRYQARYRTPDKKEKSHIWATKREAERWLRDNEGSLDRGTWIDSKAGKITTAKWIEEWMPSRKMDLRGTSYDRLTGVVKAHVVPEFGRQPINTITNSQVRAWVGELIGSGLSAATTRKALFGLRSALAAAMADGRLGSNPAADVPLPVEEHREQRIAEPTQVDALAEMIDARYRVVVFLGARVGLRWGEMLGLRRCDVDVLRNRVHVRQTVTQTTDGFNVGMPKTKGSKRTIPVARKVMAEIEQHMGAYVSSTEDARLLSGLRGDHLHRGSFNRQVWQPAIKAAGVDPLRVHDLRHSYASWLISAGASVKQVQQWCGHASVTTTIDLYTHLLESDGDALTDRLDAMLDTSTNDATVTRLRGANG